MAPIGNVPLTVTITVSPETAKVLLDTAKAQLKQDEAELRVASNEYDRLRGLYNSASKRYDTAKAKVEETKKQVEEIERVTAPRTLVGTREYASASRVGVRHTVTKWRVSGKDEYECSCEAYRFSKTTPRTCKHTSRAFYDWFIQPRFGTGVLPKGYEFSFTGVKPV